MPVELKLTFNSLEELETFLNRPASGVVINQPVTAPTQQPSPPLAATSVAAPSPPAASVIPLTSTAGSAAPAQTTQPLDLAKHEMTQLMTKLPSGQGALKVKEILSKYGLSRLGAATPEQLSALVNDFQAAQLAA